MSSTLNYAAAFSELARHIGTRPALRWSGRSWTYGEIDDRSGRLADVLLRHGVGGAVGKRDDPSETGQDHVALCLSNGNGYLESMVGVMKARAVPCNVNFRYVATEVAYLFDDAATAAVIFQARFAGLIAEGLSRCAVRPSLLLQVPDGSDVPLLPGALDYEEALRGAPGPSTAGGLSPDDRYIIYTGGTTGMPKGVIWSQSDYITRCLRMTDENGEPFALAPMVERAVERGARLRMLPAAPFMHGAAQWMAMSCWLSGGTIVLPDEPAKALASDILDTIERERCTSLQMVGDAFARPLIEEHARRPRQLETLRQVLSGGALLSSVSKEALAKMAPNARIVDTIGSSESGTIGLTTGVGHSYLPTSACVLSEDKRALLPTGSTSIGWLASSGAMPAGYLRDPEKTAATFIELDGVRYSVIGDRAQIAADGTIVLLGRESSCINTGGEKVYAEEVEQVLKRHPAVVDCLVVGRPHDLWGNEVVAVVELTRGSNLAEQEDGIRLVASHDLARYKIPKEFIPTPRVHRLENGKPDYRWATELVRGA